MGPCSSLASGWRRRRRDKVQRAKCDHTIAQLQARCDELEVNIARGIEMCKRMIAIAQKKQRSAQLCASHAIKERDRAVERLESLGRRISAVALEHEGGGGRRSDPKKDGNERRKSLDTVNLD